ncbi:hypothetical protein O9993_12575 [Vibrio lentus]|nr:hypothetical protein [Vibrio lentus]
MLLRMSRYLKPSISTVTRGIHDVQPWLGWRRGLVATKSNDGHVVGIYWQYQLWGDESYLREAELLSHTFCS